MHFSNKIIDFSISCEFRRRWDNPIWVSWRKILKVCNKQINNCYNLYYKLQGKPIIGPLERYKLQELLESKDIESKVLGISALIEYSAGNDLLRDCSCRMYTEDWDYELKKHVRQYFKCGNVQLSNDTKIQEIIDDLKRLYLSIPEGTTAEKIYYKCQNHLSYISYWMAYSPRIGAQLCHPLGEFERCCNPYWPNKNEPNIILIEENQFFDEIKTWDWRLQHYDYPIKAEEYWKHHKRPDLSNFI